MKKAAGVIFILIFAVSMFHYFYGEEHCPARFPLADGGFEHVHHHHGNASTCLCFLSALFAPESDVWDGAADLWVPLAPAGESRLFASLGADIAHPPNSFPA